MQSSIDTARTPRSKAHDRLLETKSWGPRLFTFLLKMLKPCNLLTTLLNHRVWGFWSNLWSTRPIEPFELLLLFHGAEAPYSWQWDLASTSVWLHINYSIDIPFLLMMVPCPPSLWLEILSVLDIEDCHIIHPYGLGMHSAIYHNHRLQRICYSGEDDCAGTTSSLAAAGQCRRTAARWYTKAKAG